MMRIVVLASGRGSNFQAILDRVREGTLPLEIAALISDNPDAKALTIAANAGIRTIALDYRCFAHTKEYNRALMAAIAELAPDYIVLAGYMRILAVGMVKAYPRRILNIHPSLLPSFPGLHGQKQALDYGVKIAGCTVHFVDEGMDTGEIIAQRAVGVYPDDTEETLSARILAEEHQLYSAVLLSLCPGTAAGS